MWHVYHSHMHNILTPYCLLSGSDRLIRVSGQELEWRLVFNVLHNSPNSLSAAAEMHLGWKLLCIVSSLCSLFDFNLQLWKNRSMMHGTQLLNQSVVAEWNWGQWEECWAGAWWAAAVQSLSVCPGLECWDLPQEWAVLQPQCLCGKGGAIMPHTSLTSRAPNPVTLTHQELHGTSGHKLVHIPQLSVSRKY